MKKNYQKPTIESIKLNKVQLLQGSCTSFSIPACGTSDTGCSGFDAL